VFNLDNRLGGSSDEEDSGPVTISVDGDDETDDPNEPVDIDVEDAASDDETDDESDSSDVDRT